MAEFVSLNEKGLVYSDYPTILTWFREQYKQIYGKDVYLEADSQDGQWIAVQALAMYDLVQIASMIYNSFSPLTAQSDGLSRQVKINGIARHVATNSTVDLKIVGQVGSIIRNGVAEDMLRQKWIMPKEVVIPEAGEITVTAAAEDIGAITAAENTVTKIVTPTLGWQSVNNPQAAVVGAAIETDAELRRRQTYSTALPSLTVLDGTIGAVASLDGVTRVKGYENDTNKIDARGIPAHSIAVVAEGGNAQEIAESIAKKKTPGAGTFGTTAVMTYDQYGEPNEIKFFRPTVVDIKVQIAIKPLQGYVSTYGDAIAQAIAQMINRLGIGDDVLISKLYVPANLPNNVAFHTFDIVSVKLARDGATVTADNIKIAFNEAGKCRIEDIELVVT